MFAVLTALLALALQGKPPQPGARWALRPGAALAVAAVLAGAVGVADELHQATLPGRVAGLDDLLADAVGFVWGCWWRGGFGGEGAGVMDCRVADASRNDGGYSLLRAKRGNPFVQQFACQKMLNMFDIKWVVMSTFAHELDSNWTTYPHPT